VISVNSLKQLRLSRNLTQPELAKAIGVSLRSYQSYEYDQVKPNVDIAQQIARKLGKTIDEIFPLQSSTRTTNENQPLMNI
jgi:putative transcriptional regulator